MPFIINCVLHIIALSFYAVSLAISLKNRKQKGFLPLIFMIVAAIIWASSSLSETISQTTDGKLFWRNFSRVGSYLIPVAAYCFTVSFTDTMSRILKHLRIEIIIIYIVMLVLTFTDKSSHLIRSSFGIMEMPGYSILDNHYTLLGNIFLWYNFLLAFTSVLILFTFYVKAEKLFKKQILYVSSGISMIIVLAWSDITNNPIFLGKIPVSTVFVLSSLLILVGMFRCRIFSIAPFARDKIVDMIDQGVIVTSFNGKIVDINNAAIGILDCISQSTDINYSGLLQNGKMSRSNMEKIFYIIKDNFYDWYEHIINMTDGQLIIRSRSHCNPKYYSVSISLIKNRKETVGTISILKDITKEQEYMRKLKIKSETDCLTNLLNRSAFVETVENELSKSTDSSTRIWMVFMDIDRFKTINDTYGHSAGDQILIEITQIVNSCIRENDVFGRIGGEEFCIFSMINGKEKCYAFCERIRTSVENHIFLLNNIPIHVTVSIGCIDTGISGFNSCETLINESDSLLYRAKQNGRNRVETLVYSGNDITVNPDLNNSNT